MNTEKPKYDGEHYEHIDSADLLGSEINIRLSHDFDRFSSGTIHAGLHLAEFKTESGVAGSVTGGGATLGVTVGSRSWQISLEEIVNLVIKADEKYLARLPG